MKINYDKKADAMYIKFSNSPYYASDEIKDGIVFDYDKNGKIIAIEILDASKNLKAPKSEFCSVSFKVLQPHLKLVRK